MAKQHLVKVALIMAGAILAATSLTSCAEKAMINDIAVPIELDSGYRVVGIGGEAPERSSHPFITVVPYVNIPPGKYRIDIEPKKGNSARESFYFSPKAGITYRIHKKENGTFTLIEDVRKTNPKT